MARAGGTVICPLIYLAGVSGPRSWGPAMGGLEGVGAVLLDLYWTMVYEVREEEEACRAEGYARVADVLSSTGHSVEPEDVERAHRAAFEAELERLRGTMDELDAVLVFWRALEALGVEPTVPLVRECLDAFYGAEVGAVRLFPDVRPALERLRSAGVRLAVVSNATLRFEYVVSRLGLASLFDALVASYKVTKVKPHPAVFEAALRLLGAEPSEAVMVGDSYGADVVGAKRLGMRAVLVARGGLKPSLPMSLGPPPDAVVRDLLELCDLLGC